MAHEGILTMLRHVRTADEPLRTFSNDSFVVAVEVRLQRQHGEHVWEPHLGTWRVPHLYGYGVLCHRRAAGPEGNGEEECGEAREGCESYVLKTKRPAYIYAEMN